MFTNKGGESGRDADESREQMSASSAAKREFVDQVHAWVVYRREVMHTPLHTLEAEIGISRSAVNKFYRQRSNPIKNWPKLRDWYIRTRGAKVDEYQTPPELMVASALQLVSQLPNSRRPSALRATVEHFRAIHAGLPIPEWVEMLDDLVRRETSG